MNRDAGEAAFGLCPARFGLYADCLHFHCGGQGRLLRSISLLRAFVPGRAIEDGWA